MGELNVKFGSFELNSAIRFLSSQNERLITLKHYAWQDYQPDNLYHEWLTNISLWFCLKTQQKH